MASSSSLYDVRVEELNAHSVRAPQPSRGRVALRDHQLAALHKCIGFEGEEVPLPAARQAQREGDGTSTCVSVLENFVVTRVGIIGDRAGAGKSYVILSLVMDDTRLKRSPLMHACGLNKVFVCYNDQLRQVKTNMLVVPYNLCAQWEAYIQSFAPDLRYVMINRSRAFESLHGLDVESVDLMVVSSTFYNRVAHLISTKGVRLYRVFFDEADNVSIPSCERVEARFYWFVTASYGNLLYPRGYSYYEPSANMRVMKARGLRDSGFIRNLFTDMSPSLDVAKILVVKNEDAFVTTSMSIPAPETHIVRCRTPYALSILAGIAENGVIESLNASDAQSALLHVNPACKGTEDNIIERIIDRYTRNVRNIDARMEFCRAYEYHNEAERDAEIARLERRRQEQLTRIESIRERIRTTETCSVCLDSFVAKSIVPCCSNAFCYRCIQRWILRNPRCPMCKSPLGQTDVLVVDPTCADAPTDTSAILHPSNDKLTNLRIILGQLRSDARVLIFSAYDNTFAQVVPLLDALGLRHDFLKGNQSKTNKVVQDYRAANVRVLLVNARNYGCGLNLENTTDVIMFHKFDSEIERQVVGRANRFGQRGTLRVFYLLHENEVLDAAPTAAV